MPASASRTGVTVEARLPLNARATSFAASGRPDRATTEATATPFPDTSDEALRSRVRDAAEKLDALRQDVRRD